MTVVNYCVQVSTSGAIALVHGGIRGRIDLAHNPIDPARCLPMLDVAVEFWFDVPDEVAYVGVCSLALNCAS